MRLLLLAALWMPLWVMAQVAEPTLLDPVANKRAMALAAELRCLVCQNQSIAESNAELAVDLRRQINEQIAQGRSDAEITGFMVERYGDFVLYRPPLNASTVLLWLGPPVLLIVAVTGLLLVLRNRRRREAELPLSDEEQRLAEEILGKGNSR